MKKIMLGLAVVGAAMFPEMVFAADAKETTEHIVDQMDAIKQGALAVAFMFGLFLFIMGLYGIYKDSKQPGQDHAKKGFISLAIGTLLLIVPTVIGIAAGTFSSGDDDDAQDAALDDFDGF